MAVATALLAPAQPTTHTLKLSHRQHSPLLYPPWPLPAQPWPLPAQPCPTLPPGAPVPSPRAATVSVLLCTVAPLSVMHRPAIELTPANRPGGEHGHSRRAAEPGGAWQPRYRPLAPTSGQAMQSIAVGDAVGASWPATRVEGLCGGVVWRGCIEGLYGGVVSCDNFYLVNI